MDLLLWITVTVGGPIIAKEKKQSYEHNCSLLMFHRIQLQSIKQFNVLLPTIYYAVFTIKVPLCKSLLLSTYFLGHFGGDVSCVCKSIFEPNFVKSLWVACCWLQPGQTNALDFFPDFFFSIFACLDCTKQLSEPFCLCQRCNFNNYFQIFCNLLG